MRDESKPKDRSADLALLDKLTNPTNPEERLEEGARAQIYREQSQKNFDAWLNHKPVPYWGTERK